jgi:hypothetical protein
MPEENLKPKGSGIGVDASGGPVIDPTFNVLQLVSAAMTRQDDLRRANRREFKAVIKAERRRINEQMRIRAQYERWLIKAEAKRIDAIRSVDVNAVTVAASRAQDQATVLANQLASSAETLRALVESTRSATASQLSQLITPITDRIALLEKAQYSSAGKEAVTDPLMTQVLLEIKSLRESRTEGTGEKAGSQAQQRLMMMIISIIVSLLIIGGIVVSIAFAVKR